MPHIQDAGGILPLASRNGTFTGDKMENFGCRGLDVFINITAGSGAVVVTIYNLLGSNKVAVLASASLSGVTTKRLRVYPTLTGSANTDAQDFIDRNFEIDCVGNGTALTYSVDYSLVP